ncbi:MAG: hypothetical protein M3Q55_01430 [Acidobacteriota bacterium]|nr:hypothetical protein [Acidobacteriota bacterium]
MSPFNRKLIYAIFVYTCIEGLVVNVTFPSKLGYIVKDFALVISVGLLLMDNKGQRFGSLSRLQGPLMIFAFVQCAFLMMSGDMPLLAKLVGLKMRILYIPAMLIGYRFVRHPMDVYKLVAVLAISAIPVSIFGVYLYFAGPSALQAIGGTYSAVVNSTTGVWRVPGTFNSPGQYGLYLMFNSVMVTGLLLTPDLQARFRALLWASLSLMTLAVLVSGSRTPLILAVAGAGMVLLGTGRFGRMVSMGIGLYIVFAIGFATFGAGVSDRVGSIASIEHIERFQGTYFGQMFIPTMLETPMGIGLGAATIGARHFTEFNEVILIESYFGVVAVETGVMGVLTLLLVTASILLFVFKARALMRTSSAASIWFAFASFVAIAMLISPVSTPLDSAPGNVYFWFSLGIIAKLYDMERWGRAEALSAQAPYQGQAA